MTANLVRNMLSHAAKLARKIFTTEILATAIMTSIFIKPMQFAFEQASEEFKKPRIEINTIVKSLSAIGREHQCTDKIALRNVGYFGADKIHVKVRTLASTKVTVPDLGSNDLNRKVMNGVAIHHFIIPYLAKGQIFQFETKDHSTNYVAQQEQPENMFPEIIVSSASGEPVGLLSNAKENSKWGVCGEQDYANLKNDISIDAIQRLSQRVTGFKSGIDIIKSIDSKPGKFGQWRATRKNFSPHSQAEWTIDITFTAGNSQTDFVEKWRYDFIWGLKRAILDSSFAKSFTKYVGWFLPSKI